MAYQSRQPCMPPPISMPQCSTQDTCSSSCVSQCNDPCAVPCSGGSSHGSTCDMSYQSTQPCLPPPVCAHSSPTETMNDCASPCESFCNIAPEESCCCPSMEVSSPTSCTSPTAQPLPSIAEPCSPEIMEMHNSPCVALYTAECPEEPAAPSREPVLSYVLPGSVVCLDPCGTITVKPAPVDDGECEEERDSIFVGSYTPHFP